MADLKKTAPNRNEPVALPTWPDEVYRVLKEADVRQVGMVPDAGHRRLIRASACWNSSCATCSSSSRRSRARRRPLRMPAIPALPWSI